MLLASAQETRLQLRIKARLSAFFMLQVGHGFKPCRKKNLSAGYKTLPYKENWLNVGRGFTPRR